MSIKISQVKKKWWAKVPLHERKKIMSARGKASAAKRSPEQMQRQIAIMVEARRLKLKKANA